MADPAVQHLVHADRVMARLVTQFGELSVEERKRGRPEDPYGALLRSIVGQQLSVKAARTIYERLLTIFDGKVPTPQQLRDTNPDDLRAAGLSRPKISYLQDLAEHVLDGRLKTERLPALSDEDVTAELIAVKGLGQWTADMFLMFHLQRPDVLPVGDLGIRRSAKIQYGLPDLPGPTELEKIAEPWRPYRTLACLYLWQSLDNAPE